MTVLVRERAAVGEDGHEIRFKRADRGASIVVSLSWTCGESRSFTPDDLANVVFLLGALDGEWLEHQDGRGRRFAARVVGGQLFAAERVGAAAYAIPWDSVKKAIKKAA